MLGGVAKDQGSCGATIISSFGQFNLIDTRALDW